MEILNKLILVFICLYSVSLFAGDIKCGLSGTVNMVSSNGFFAPVPSVSISIVKKKSIHDISGEYFRSANETDEAGVCYSYLRYLVPDYVLLGPSAGIVYSEENKGSSLYSSGIKQGIYFLGAKGMLKLGNKEVALIIQERLLFGFKHIYGKDSMGINNLIGAGAILVF